MFIYKVTKQHTRIVSNYHDVGVQADLLDHRTGARRNCAQVERNESPVFGDLSHHDLVADGREWLIEPERPVHVDGRANRMRELDMTNAREQEPGGARASLSQPEDSVPGYPFEAIPRSSYTHTSNDEPNSVNSNGIYSLLDYLLALAYTIQMWRSLTNRWWIRFNPPM